MKYVKSEKGLIQTIIIIILTIIILSLLGISIRTLIEKISGNDLIGENFNYVWNGIKKFFDKYLSQYYFQFQDLILNQIKNAFSRIWR